MCDVSAKNDSVTPDAALIVAVDDEKKDAAASGPALITVADGEEKDVAAPSALITVADDGEKDSATVDFDGLWSGVMHTVCDALEDRGIADRIENLKFISFDGGTVTLGAPTRFSRDRIRAECGKTLLTQWQNVLPGVMAVSVVAGGTRVTNKVPEPQIPEKEPLAPAAQAAPPADGLSPAEFLLSESKNDSVYDKRFVFDNFVVGPSNELAFSAAQKVASNGGVTFNPLFFHGGVGLGKTHLMHAIALGARALNPERKIVYLSAEQFMYRFVNAIRNYDMQAFKEEFRNVDLLLIDDLQFIAGKNGTQEEFFHTFNALVDGKKQIVISADRSPGDMDNMEERIKSRLAWGLVANIHQTDFSLRKSILNSKVKLLQKEYPGLFVPNKVIEFLALKITGNVRDLEGAVNRLAAHTAFTGRPVTLEMTEEVIADMLRYAERKLTPAQIQRRVAEFFNVNLQDMLSGRRSRDVARPRQIAMYLTKSMTNLSLPDIGRKFGGRDHTTVLHSCKRIEELLGEDIEFANQLEKLACVIRHT